MCSPEELSRSRAQGQTARRWPEAHIPCQLLISPDVYSVERTPARSLEWLGRAFECISLASRRSQAAMLQEAVASILECTVLQATTWDRYGICALKEECFKRKIPLDNLIERRHVLARLYDVLAWEQMSLKQLQSECWRRRIPFVNRTRVSNVVLLETENPHFDGEADLVRRLVQDAFPGATGPLPVGGISGIWEPGEGSYKGAKPGSRSESERVAAWTGATAPGYDKMPQSGESRGWSAPCGPPPGARQEIVAAGAHVSLSADQDSPSFSSNMPLLDSPVLYPAPKVQWYTPTPRKPSHENPLGIVFPEDTEKEMRVTGARGVREGSPPEDLMMVKIDGALDLLPSDNFGPHFYCATAYYPGEGNAEINARKTEFAVGKANPARPDLDNCMLQKTVLVPYNRKQQLLMVEIHEVDPEDSEVEDCLIGQATLPLADRKIESSSNWPLFRGFESSGSLAVQVHIPQVNSTGPKTLDCTTPSVCKRSRRSNTPPKGFPEPVSPVSWTLPYRCKRSERSDTPPEGFPEPVSPSKVSRPTLLESLRHGKQTPEKKKCQAFDKDACTRDMGSSQIFTGCAPCDAFLESMRKGPDLLEHSPFLNSLMSGVDPVADVDIRLPTQASCMPQVTGFNPAFKHQSIDGSSLGLGALLQPVDFDAGPALRAAALLRAVDAASELKAQGDRLLKRGEATEARERYAAARLGGSWDVDLRAQLHLKTAEALRLEGELEEALTEVSEACSFMDREKSAPALLLRGILRFDSGKWRESLEDFEKAQDLATRAQQISQDLAAWLRRAREAVHRKDSRNFYAILGLRCDCDSSDVKKRFHKLALQCHPDKVHSTSEVLKKSAEARFKAIQEAYEVLSDPKRRQEYDYGKG
ncbi:unnamed protein product [Symbiodinium microadriaticum]|nr:unnamed protein product [Symbiodinium microadriaticum]